jgi:hypothetical protein
MTRLPREIPLFYRGVFHRDLLSLPFDDEGNTVAEGNAVAEGNPVAGGTPVAGGNTVAEGNTLDRYFSAAR